jgi:hypothetical protein
LVPEWSNIVKNSFRARSLSRLDNQINKLNEFHRRSTPCAFSISRDFPKQPLLFR